MKTINGITSQEVLLSHTLLNVFDLEIDGGILCKDNIIILVDGKKIKMITEGTNTIDDETVLFRPLKSKSISLFLIQELMELDWDVDVFLEETNKKEKSMFILDSDRNILANTKHKDLKKCIISTLIKYFFGSSIEGNKYLNIINDYK